MSTYEFNPFTKKPDKVGEGGGGGGVTSVNTRTGAVTLDKTDVGLGNVDNTSDANKPVSTAQQTALDGKQPIDADLTAIAGLTPSNDDIIQRKAGSWVARTIAQLATDLGLSGYFNKSTDDTDDITEGSTNKFATAAEKTKLGHITVSQAVDLDDIETRVNNLDAAVVLKGTWDASAGTFPGGGTAQAGASYIVSVAGTVDGVAFAVGDRVIAITDNASTTTFAANWFKADYTDQVLSVNGMTGVVTITTITGNAGTATALQTARNIDGQAFDGTANITVIAPGTHAATSKPTPVDADEVPLVDSAASNVLKRLTWANLKATLKTYFDTLYVTFAGGTFTGDIEVPYEAYGAGWTSSNEAPTKRAVDEALNNKQDVLGGAALPAISLDDSDRFILQDNDNSGNLGTYTYLQVKDDIVAAAGAGGGISFQRALTITSLRM